MNNAVQLPTINTEAIVVIGFTENVNFEHVMLNIMGYIVLTDDGKLPLDQIPFVFEGNLSDPQFFDLETWLRENQIISQGQSVTNEVVLDFARPYLTNPYVAVMTRLLRGQTPVNAREIFNVLAQSYHGIDLIEKFTAHVLTLLGEYSIALGSSKVINYTEAIKIQRGTDEKRAVLTLTNISELTSAEVLAVHTILLGEYREQFDAVVVTSDGAESETYFGHLVPFFEKSSITTIFLENVLAQMNKAEMEYGSSSDVVWSVSGMTLSQVRPSSIPVSHRSGNWNGVIKVALSEVFEPQDA